MPYIRDTVRSVLSQDYADLEYIVVDAGSTDGTIEYLRSLNDPRLRVIVAKTGQYEAINLGFESATGDVFAWINADDCYMPWTFSSVADVFGASADVKWVVGLPSYMNRRSQCMRVASHVSTHPRKYITRGYYNNKLFGCLQQESMFWSSELWRECGGLDLSLLHAADFELWTRFARRSDLVSVPIPLAAFRFRGGEQRSVLYKADYEAEVAAVISRLRRRPGLLRHVCSAGQVIRCLVRLSIWRRGRAARFSQTWNTWKIEPAFGPVSWHGLLSLSREAFGRRNDRVQHEHAQVAQQS